jgi:hypothetical protein
VEPWKGLGDGSLDPLDQFLAIGLQERCLAYYMVTVIAIPFLVSACEYVGESANHLRELFYRFLFQIVYTRQKREDNPLFPARRSWTFLQEESCRYHRYGVA